MRVVGHGKAWEQAISSAARSFEPHYLNEAPTPIFQAVVELAAMGYLTALGKPFSASAVQAMVDSPMPPKKKTGKGDRQRLGLRLHLRLNR